MDHSEYHQKLDIVLELAHHARASSASAHFDKQVDKAVLNAIELFNELVGDIYAQSLWKSGYAPLPVVSQSDDFQAFNKKALARFVYDMRSLFTRARMAPEIIIRDLHQMTLNNGSTPIILSTPARDQSFRDNRDIKKTARQLVCEIVYHEHGRTKKTITQVRRDLNRVNDCYFEAERKAWERMTREVSKKERERFKNKGRRADKPHPRIERFEEIWKIANTP